MGAKAWESGTKYLGAFSGAGYAWDRGLGWDAGVLFWKDKAGPRPSRDT